MGSFLLGILGGCCLSGGVLLLLSAPEKKHSRKAQIPAMISFQCPNCGQAIAENLEGMEDE